MKENFYLTKNTIIDYSLLSHDSSGLIASVSLSTVKSLNESEEIWTLKPLDWLNYEKSSFASYSDIEVALEKTGVFMQSYSLPIGIFGISHSIQVSNPTPETVISAIANKLEFDTYFNPIILG
ncbi:MAG: hypothetical protein PHY72_04090 [Candidatus Pacebacteria bacterium]|nr:hypothetical protein [Candidatus Paceibacterota bacterium]